MPVDLIGRINNTDMLSQTESLTHSKTLFPLFEATSNSIYSIKDADIPNEHIDIFIERDDCQIEFKVRTQDIRPIKKFRQLDINNKVGEFAEDPKLITSPDNMGYFGYDQSLTTYVEIISFDKLITDAKKRNQILFKR